MSKKDGGARAPEKLPTRGPISGGVHVFKDKKARVDPMPKVHSAKKFATKP